MGTGVYIDDIDSEIARRKTLLIQRLKLLLTDTKIGKNGYIYIFDSKAKMIIHHDSTMEGKIFDKMLNPDTDTFIFNDLTNAYKNGDKVLYYLWDSPGDRGNFTYEKVSWIGHDSYFDWYICSSGYLSEFHSHSKNLKRYIIYIIILMTIFISSIGFYFLRKILNPIAELSHTAHAIGEGHLDKRYKGIINNDETGTLAKQFNFMLDTINEQIETLDSRVQEKTKELSDSLNEKEMLLRELHHRVKNNLFVISGIIGLEAFKEKGVTKEELIEGIQNRIQAIALAHEMLSRDGRNHHIVSMDVYIRKLTDTLISALIGDNIVSPIYDIDDIELSLDQVLSVGLIINELVTNAIKYALNNKYRYLKISMKLVSDGMVILSLEDNGSGFDSSQIHGTGLDLVEMSAIQLNGKLQIDSLDRTKVSIIFPLD